MVLENIRWPEISGSRKEGRGTTLRFSFDQSDLERRLLRMKSCLVGKVVGHKHSIGALRMWGKRVWKINGELQVQHLPNGLYLFNFPLSVEADRVLREELK